MTDDLEILRSRLAREKSARLEAERIAEEATRDLYVASERLRSSNQSLEQFAFIASHDLQEPLRKITAFGSRLKDQYREVLDERGKDYLDRMVSGATRMRRLIEDLLEYSRITTRGEAFSPVDLGAAAKDVLVDLEGRMEATGATVEVGDLPTVAADAGQMRQLLQNLIGNAIKYHRTGVAPLVRVMPLGSSLDRVAFVVEDNGIGFDPAFSKRIFLPFQRLHGRTSAYDGTGIGLAVCARIAERHGGRIEAHSVPGEGSRFVVELAVRPTEGRG